MLRTLIAAGLALVTLAPAAAAAAECPAEVKTARDLLNETQARERSARRSRALAGSRMPEARRAAVTPEPRARTLESPRAQDAQAPRGTDAQAPRTGDAAPPRGQDAQAPRGQDAQAPRGAADDQPSREDSASRGRTSALVNAGRLVRDAESACRENDPARAGASARAALELLKYLQ